MISPEMPEGMGIASDSGAIYGTSATALDRTEFVVTASNSAGSANVTIFLTVEVPHCPAMADFPRTAASESYAFDCTQISGYKGVSERTCVLNEDKASATWSIPISYCVEDKLGTNFLIGIVLIIIGVVLLVLGIFFMVKRDRKYLPKKPVSKTAPPSPIPMAPAPYSPAPVSVPDSSPVQNAFPIIVTSLSPAQVPVPASIPASSPVPVPIPVPTPTSTSFQAPKPHPFLLLRSLSIPLSIRDFNKHPT